MRAIMKIIRIFNKMPYLKFLVIIGLVNIFVFFFIGNIEIFIDCWGHGTYRKLFKSFVDWLHWSIASGLDSTVYRIWSKMIFILMIYKIIQQLVYLCNHRIKKTKENKQ